MRVLVTGGSGFIGTRLVGELLAQGHQVVIFDKVPSARYPELSMVGDVRDAGALARAVPGIDVVYHLAAEHQDDVRPVSLYYEVNVEGSRLLAEACAAHGVARLIFTSSVAVYGLNAGEPSEDSPPNPFNDYGRSKLEAEKVLRCWGEAQESRALTIVRPTVIFGEGNRGNVYNLVRQIASGRFVMVGAGTNRKSMGYVGNVAAFLALLGATAGTGISVYNYADKPDLSMNELVSFVRQSTGQGGGMVLRIPYWVGMAGGLGLDAISLVSGRKFSVSSVRVKKFCASTTIAVEKLKGTAFAPPFSLAKGMQAFLVHEFGAKPQGSLPNPYGLQEKS